MAGFEDGLRELVREIVREVIRDELRAASASSMSDEYLSVAEASRIAGIHEDTLRRWIRTGKLPECRAGRAVRVRRRDLDGLLVDGARNTNREASPVELARRRFGG